MLTESNDSILEMSIFFKNINIFRQLRPEIALAIPALNEWKIETNNSVVRTRVNVGGEHVSEQMVASM